LSDQECKDFGGVDFKPLEMGESIRGEELISVGHVAPVLKPAAPERPKEKEAREERPLPTPRECKRAKPNEPCPCGTGKKYKKCCGKNNN